MEVGGAHQPPRQLNFNNCRSDQLQMRDLGRELGTLFLFCFSPDMFQESTRAVLKVLDEDASGLSTA